MVRILDGRFFALAARSVCSNVLQQLKRNEHYMLTYHESRELDEVTKGVLWWG